MIFDILGNIGMVLITISLIPQVIKTYKEKKADDISIIFSVSQLVAGFCMIPYGIYLNSIPIIVINIGMTVNQLLLMYMILKYGKKYNNTIEI